MELMCTLLWFEEWMLAVPGLQRYRLISQNNSTGVWIARQSQFGSRTSTSCTARSKNNVHCSEELKKDGIGNRESKASELRWDQEYAVENCE